jgi:hypothetical protein
MVFVNGEAGIHPTHLEGLVPDKFKLTRRLVLIASDRGRCRSSYGGSRREEESCYEEKPDEAVHLTPDLTIGSRRRHLALRCGALLEMSFS